MIPRLSILVLLILMLSGCQGLQKTLHYATLGLVNNPDVSDQAKVELVEKQQEAILREKEAKRYHTVALGFIILGTVFFFAGQIAEKYVPSFNKKDSAMGLLLIAFGIGLAIFAGFLARAGIKWFGWTIISIFGIGVIYGMVRPLIKHKLEMQRVK